MYPVATIKGFVGTFIKSIAR